MKALPWVLALACLALAAWAGDGARDAAGEAARLRAANDSLARVAARVDTVYQRDTLRLWRAVRAVDTLTVTVDQWKHDTVRVVEYVQRADLAIRACVATVTTCEQRVALRDARIAVLDSLNAATADRLKAERRRRVRDAVLALGAGWLAGKAGVP